MLTAQRLLREIKVGQRYRTDASADVESLAKSIKEIGLIHAITIDTDNNLVAGWRRLKAYASLGIKQIPVNIVDTLTSASIALSAERVDTTEAVPMSNADMLIYVAKLAELDRPEARARRSAAISRGNKVRYATGQPSQHVKLTWRDRAPDETRTIVGKTVGMSPATTSRLISIARRLDSKDQPVKELAEKAYVDLVDGVAIHTAFERMSKAIREIKAGPMPVAESANGYILRRRDEMAAAKFQREIINDVLVRASSMIPVLERIATKLNTYGVHEEITPDERAQWIKDIARTRRALSTVLGTIKGGTGNDHE